MLVVRQRLFLIGHQAKAIGLVHSGEAIDVVSRKFGFFGKPLVEGKRLRSELLAVRGIVSLETNRCAHFGNAHGLIASIANHSDTIGMPASQLSSYYRQELQIRSDIIRSALAGISERL